VVSAVQFAPISYLSPASTGFPTTAPYAPRSYRTPTSIPRNIDEATELAKAYVASLGYPDLAVKEIMEFQYNYYFIAYEKSTGIGAFEGVIEKGLGLSGMAGMMGIVHPEQGPNMMWNTKYGHMAGRGPMGGRHRGFQPYGSAPTADMPVTENQAKQIAQDYLDVYLPGSSTEDPDTFYGYYTIHVLKDGKAYGMLSVNGYTRQVWYHTWHGAFVQMKEFD